MLDGPLRITVPGHPAPKGSLKCIGARGGRGHVLIEDNKRTKGWRETIAHYATRSPAAGPGQPLSADVVFTLPRPRSHYGTGRNANTLKPNAPTHPVSHATGDLDKLLRLVLDALQDAKVIPDDCAVVEAHTRKVYPCQDPQDPGGVRPWPGVVITLSPAT